MKKYSEEQREKQVGRWGGVGVLSSSYLFPANFSPGAFGAIDRDPAGIILVNLAVDLLSIGMNYPLFIRRSTGR